MIHGGSWSVAGTHRPLLTLEDVARGAECGPLPLTPLHLPETLSQDLSPHLADT